MNLVIAGILTTTAIVKRNKKWAYFILLTFLWFLFWNNDSSPDRISYLYKYRVLKHIEIRGDMEIGFQAAILLAKRLGMSAKMFFAAYSLLGYSLITYTVFKFSKNPALVLSLYFFYPYLLDAEQMRSFFGMSLVMCGVTFLTQKTRRGIILYLVLCVLATMFQTSCCVFVLFVLAFLPLSLLYKIVGIATAVMLFIKRGGALISKILPFIPIDKLLRNLSSRNAGIKGMVSVIYFLFGILFFAYIGKMLYYESADQDKRVFYDFVRRFNIISIMFLPLIFLSDNFTRLPRSIFILNYILLSNVVSKRITKRRELLLLVIGLSFAGCRFLAYMFGAGWDSYIVPFFYGS